MRRLIKIIDCIESTCVLGSAIAVSAIMFLTVIDVILRKLTHYGISGLYELTQDYLMVALVFLSISHVYKRGGHVRVTLFQAMIPKFLQKPIQKTIEILVLVFLVVIAYTGFMAGMSAWTFEEVSSSILAYPLAPALFMVPLGCGLTALRVMQALFGLNTLKQTDR